MVLDQRFLGLGNGFLDGMQLLRDIEAGPPPFDHADNVAQMAFRPLQPVQNVGVAAMEVLIVHGNVCYPPGEDMTSRQRQGSMNFIRASGLRLTALLVVPLFWASSAFAHAVAQGDKGYIQEIGGVHLLPFVYLGAKHMITGYDHILFLLGVIFFLYRLKHVALYVSLFALGHSTTMLLGVYFDFGIDSYLIDAIIGLSVVYKALDNIGAFQRWFGYQPGTKLATLIFGFFHGFGLASKVIDYDISPDGLLANLIAFNVGVEIGQLLALAAILIVMGYWRRTGSFMRHAYTANVALMAAGFVLVGYQLTGYFIS